MTGKLKTWLCGVVIVGAAGLSLAAWSMGPAGGHGPDPARMLERLGDRLDLSAEQRLEAEQRFAQVKENTANDREQMRLLRAELTGMRGNYDAARALEISDEIGRLTGQMVFEVSQSWALVYQSLDDQQKAQLDDLIAKFGDRRRAWHDHGEQASP